MPAVTRHEEVAIACDFSAFTDEERDRHGALVQELMGKVTEVHELPQGYSLRLSDEDRILFKIADFIQDESLCCAFFHFEMEVEPNRAAIWLKLSGSDDVKAFFGAEVGPMLNEQVATAAGFR